VAALLKDHRLATEFPYDHHRASSGGGPLSDFFSHILLYRDPPAHTRLRRLISEAFSAKLIGSLGEQIQRVVDELLETVAEKGRMDAIHDLAFPLPVMVVCGLIGIPSQDRELIRPRAMDLGRAFAPIVPAETRIRANEALLWLRDYIGTLFTERRRSPQNDLLSKMLEVEQGDEPTDHDEIIDNAIFSLFAGFETTANLIGSGCVLLMTHPDELTRLRRQPDMIPQAIEEFLRFDPPIQGVARLVREPIEIGGRTLRSGRVVLLLIGSANHDEAVFRQPEQLDVSRAPNPHLSFGGGYHYCIGAHLARLEGAIVFSRLLTRFRILEPDGSFEREPNTTLRTYASVPISLELD
jgi:cytochrome P450